MQQVLFARLTLSAPLTRVQSATWRLAFVWVPEYHSFECSCREGSDAKNKVLRITLTRLELLSHAEIVFLLWHNTKAWLMACALQNSERA